MAEVHRQIQNQLEEMVSALAWALPVLQLNKTAFHASSGCHQSL